VTGTTICSPQLHLYVRILRAEVGSTNEYSSDVALPHAGHFGGWLVSESSPDIAMRLYLPNSTFLFGTVADISRALNPVISGECRDNDLRLRLSFQEMAVPLRSHDRPSKPQLKLVRNRGSRDEGPQGQDLPL
jgi:hypothetical protein